MHLLITIPVRPDFPDLHFYRFSLLFLEKDATTSIDPLSEQPQASVPRRGYPIARKQAQKPCHSDMLVKYPPFFSKTK
jgi:hypothetical protein